MEILVFKTNLRNNRDLERIGTLMSGDGRISRWNVDRKDIDKVLRIESKDLLPEEVISLVKNAGYYCEELTD